MLTWEGGVGGHRAREDPHALPGPASCFLLLELPSTCKEGGGSERVGAQRGWGLPKSTLPLRAGLGSGVLPEHPASS